MSSTLAKLRARRAGTSQEGFTLVELLVVVVIIGVLIAIAIPVYLNYTKGAKDKSSQSDLRNAIVVLEQCNSDNGSYPVQGSAAGQIPASTAGGTTATSLNACTGQSIKLSRGTTFTYDPSGTTPLSFTAHATNIDGKTVYYCYNSVNGGSVSTVATLTTAC